MAFKVQNVMSKLVVTASPNDSMVEASTSILRHHVSGLIVVDETESLVGVITENDILKLMLEAGSDSHQVSEFMTTDVKTLDEDDSLIYAVEMFLRTKVRRFPVMKDGRLTGVVSRRDLVRYIRDLRRH